MLQIGVEPQKVEYPYKTDVDIAYKVFECNHKFCCITGITNKDQINQMNPLLKDDEIVGSEDEIFTFIIGSQYFIDTDAKEINDDSTDNDGTCDVSKMHIWAKRAMSIQEILSKHGRMLIESSINRDTITTAFQNNINISDTTISNGIINKLYYAGEMKKKKNKLSINFLSGTFMDGVINARDVPDHVKNCVRTFLQTLYPFNIDIDIDESGETYVTEIMTPLQLDQFVKRNAINVSVFDTEKEANEYSKHSSNLELYKMRLDQIKKSMDDYKNKNTTNPWLTYYEIAKKNYDAATKKVPEYEPSTFLAKGIKPKRTKRQPKRLTKRQTKRQTKRPTKKNRRH